jgi:hypothetical protein
MDNNIIKEKLFLLFILLILLTLAAGSNNSWSSNKSERDNIAKSRIKANDQKNIDLFDCDYSNTNLSMILDKEVENIAPQTCLFVGCNGLTF